VPNGSERIFRASALQRAASPDELDHLVAITKPSDWILAAVLAVALVAAVMAVVQVQNVCDPTNTQNVWVANFTGDDIAGRFPKYE